MRNILVIFALSVVFVGIGRVYGVESWELYAMVFCIYGIVWSEIIERYGE